MAMKKNVLVLCVDRDDDLGRKTGIDGPVIGKTKCLEAAVALATADPADTDANTMFEAIKTADAMAATVAVVTGHEKVGVHSDRLIGMQLDKLLKKGEFEGVVLVTDGAEDEHVLPLLQSRTKILSIKKVIVKQAERLENAYYTAVDFFKKTMKDKELARLFLALPGVVLLIVAFFGTAAWRFMLGIVGVYLLVKGLHLEAGLEGFIEDFKTSFKLMRFSFLTYILSVILFFLAVFQGLNSIGGPGNLLQAILSFVHGAVFTFLLAGLAVVLGRFVDSYPNYSVMLRYLNSGVMLGVAAWILKSITSYFLEPTLGLTNFITSVMIGLVFAIIMAVIKRISVKW